MLYYSVVRRRGLNMYTTAYRQYVLLEGGVTKSYGKLCSR